jgi:hypothetical protein
MRELDPDIWLMIDMGVAWFHGLMVGWYIWRRPNLKYKNEDNND